MTCLPNIKSKLAIKLDSSEIYWAGRVIFIFTDFAANIAVI